MGPLKALLVGVSVAGIALLVCRYAFLPFAEKHNTLQYLAIGMTIGGSMGIRAIEDEVNKKLLVAGGLVGGLAALAVFWVFIKPVDAGQVELSKKEFPGIIVRVPAGEPTVNLTSSANGSWKLERIGNRPGLFELGWQTGHTEISPEQYAEIMGLAAPGVVGDITSEEVQVSGHSGRRMRFPVKEFAVFITVWYCDKHDRDFTLGTMILEPESEGLAFHGRALGGMQCHVGEKPAIPINEPTIALPDDYGFVEGSDPPTFVTLDGGELVFQPMAPNVVGEIEKKPPLVLKMFEIVPGVTGVGLAGEPINAKARDGSSRKVIRVRYNQDGQASFASVTAIGCGDQQSFMGLHSYEGVARQSSAEAVLLSAVCPDGKKPKHTTLSEVAGRACDANDGKGCYYVAAGAKNAIPPRNDEARAALERGCELEHALSCNDLGVEVAQSADDDADDKARVLYKKACDLGEELGCTNAAGIRDAD